MKAYGTIYAGTHSGLTGLRTSVTAPGADGFCVVQDIDDIRICDITRTDLSRGGSRGGGGGGWGHMPPSPLKKMYIRSRYSNRAVNHQSF